jgi:hypothetical protein
VAYKGRQIKKKQVPTYLPLCEFFLRFSGFVVTNIFMVVLSSSCRETAKNAIKKTNKNMTRNKFPPPPPPPLAPLACVCYMQYTVCSMYVVCSAI